MWAPETKNKTYLGKLPGLIRPFTNKDYSNTATSGFGLPRPLKHYRLGRYGNVINSYSPKIIARTIDAPGGYIANVGLTDSANCNGVNIIVESNAVSNNTETPQSNTQTKIWCCNAEKKAHARALPTSSKLHDNSINADIVNTYYSQLQQYRENRCQTYDQRAFNFYRSNNVNNLNENEYYAKCDSSNKNCSLVVYKPNNPQFAKEGSVKGSARTYKLKNTTIEKMTQINGYKQDVGIFTEMPFILNNKTLINKPSLCMRTQYVIT
jgi:hypothetical protein